MVNKLAGKASSPNELSYTDEEGRIISGATLAPGPDVIPTRIWKEYAAELAEPITRIFNISIASGSFPTLNVYVY